MIQYKVSLKRLAEVVHQHFSQPLTKAGTPDKRYKVSWLKRAGNEWKRLSTSKKYIEGPEGEFWRDLRIIFSSLQGNGKCAYCERCLDLHKRDPDTDLDDAIGDIEHYRPKGGVEEWVSLDGIPTGGSNALCYYRLAFHLRNYLLACRICNREYKQNFFPIAGPRADPDTCRTRELRAERPYLLHPLDPDEPDPEALFGFNGITPTIRAAVGTHDFWRAKVTIQLLGLGLGERWLLDKERALTISNLYMALESPNQTDPVVAYLLDVSVQDHASHANCARSFRNLYFTDKARAQQFAQEAKEYIEREQAKRALRRIRF